MVTIAKRIFIISLSVFHMMVSGEICFKTGFSTNCCADIYSNNGECLPCPRGYFGLHCSYSCPYPSYGHRCLDGNCRCPKEWCSVSDGCLRKNDINKWIMSAIITTLSSSKTSTDDELKIWTTTLRKNHDLRDRTQTDIKNKGTLKLT
ncbi:uncharacterized protein LOC134257122 [Saccostrea cucullata]|uniref:uncharacterized protein LOC134257122 n=1 Tax=Saccostrea cuccullata TaxID=36930 RepID=UPI002ED005A0